MLRNKKVVVIKISCIRRLGIRQRNVLGTEIHSVICLVKILNLYLKFRIQYFFKYKIKF